MALRRLSQIAAASAVFDANDFVVAVQNGTTDVRFSNSQLFGGMTAANPISNDGAALGGIGLAWSDLFIASLGTINWNNQIVMQQTSASTLNISASGAGGSILTLQNNSDLNIGANIIFFHNSASPAVSDNLGQVIFSGFDNGGNLHNYAIIQGSILSPVNAAETGAIAFNFSSSGSTKAAVLRGDTSSFDPAAAGQLALGTATFRWADLFLDAGGVINWNNGAATLFETSGRVNVNTRNFAVGANAIAAGLTNCGIIFADICTPSAAEAAALQLSPEFQPVTTTSVYGIAIAPGCDPGSATWGAFYGIRVENFGKGAGNTVNNVYGLYLDAQTDGSVLNRSLMVAGGVSEFNGQLIAQGTATNDNAAAGDIGQIIESEVLSGSAVALTNGLDTNITSISLTAGDWDVWGNIVVSPAGATTTSFIIGWISTTSAASPTAPNKGAEIAVPYAGSAGFFSIWPVGMRRISVASTTTTYLSCNVSFAVSTCTAYGYIGARRRR